MVWPPAAPLRLAIRPLSLFVFFAVLENRGVAVALVRQPRSCVVSLNRVVGFRGLPFSKPGSLNMRCGALWAHMSRRRYTRACRKISSQVGPLRADSFFVWFPCGAVWSLKYKYACVSKIHSPIDPPWSETVSKRIRASQAQIPFDSKFL